MTKKILMIISDLGSGGAQKNFTFVANTLVENKFQIRILRFDREKSFFRINTEIKVDELSLLFKSKNIVQKIIFNIIRIFKLRSFIKEKSPDVVISFMNQTNILTTLATLTIKTKVIISDRNNPIIQPGHFFWKILRKYSLRKASHIVVNSMNAFQYYKNLFPKKKIKLINNPIKINKNYIKKQKKIILTVARLHRQKSIDTLLIAFAEFLKTNKNWKLIIIGKGEEEENLKKVSKKLNIDNNTKWINQTTDINKYYRESTIFCLPSLYEGFSNALLEALSYDLKCIVSEGSISNNVKIKNYVTTFRTSDNKDLLIKLNTLTKIKKNKTSSNFLKKEFCEEKIKKEWIGCVR